MLKKKKLIIFFLLTILLTGVFVAPVLAQVMTSTNFKMMQDSLNFGGNFSQSDNYNLEDTLGELATGYSSSSNFILHAGYQQMDQKQNFLSLSVPLDIVYLEPDIPGLFGGVASGTTYVHLVTDNDYGYTLQINAQSSPAMKHIVDDTYFFANYPIDNGIPSFVWSIEQNTSAFGFTPEGSDIVTKYLDNGVSCNINNGADTTERCWGPLSTSLETVAYSSSSNDPYGITTTVRFKAENGNQHVQVSGVYRAGIVITAYMN